MGCCSKQNRFSLEIIRNKDGFVEESFRRNETVDLFSEAVAIACCDPLVTSYYLCRGITLQSREESGPRFTSRFQRFASIHREFVDAVRGRSCYIW